MPDKPALREAAAQVGMFGHTMAGLTLQVVRLRECSLRAGRYVPRDERRLGSARATAWIL